MLHKFNCIFSLSEDMIIKNAWTVFLIALFSPFYKNGTCQSYSIGRQCDENSCNVTLVESLKDGSVNKTKCQNGIFLLQENNVVTCIKNNVLESNTSKYSINRKQLR